MYIPEGYGTVFPYMVVDQAERFVDFMPYRDRQAGVTDPFSNIWWISHRLVNEPYD
jgi:hypothetical protein